MSPGVPVGLIIAAFGGLASPRFGFGMLIAVTLIDMLTAHYSGGAK